MTRRGLRNPGQPDRVLDGSLQALFAHVMPPHHAATRITRKARRRENILPTPLPVRRRILPAQRIRQINLALACRQVLFMQQLDSLQVLRQRRLYAPGQHRHSVFETLSLAHHNLVLSEIHVLDSQPERS